jgi:hypothetical protein
LVDIVLAWLGQRWPEKRILERVVLVVNPFSWGWFGSHLGLVGWVLCHSPVIPELAICAEDSSRLLVVDGDVRASNREDAMSSNTRSRGITLFSQPILPRLPPSPFLLLPRHVDFLPLTRDITMLAPPSFILISANQASACRSGTGSLCQCLTAEIELRAQGSRHHAFSS